MSTRDVCILLRRRPAHNAFEKLQPRSRLWMAQPSYTPCSPSHLACGHILGVVPEPCRLCRASG